MRFTYYLTAEMYLFWPETIYDIDNTMEFTIMYDKTILYTFTNLKIKPIE